MQEGRIVTAPLCCLYATLPSPPRSSTSGTGASFLSACSSTLGPGTGFLPFALPLQALALASLEALLRFRRWFSLASSSVSGPGTGFSHRSSLLQAPALAILAPLLQFWPRHWLSPLQSTTLGAGTGFSRSTALFQALASFGALLGLLCFRPWRWLLPALASPGVLLCLYPRRAPLLQAPALASPGTGFSRHWLPSACSSAYFPGALLHFRPWRLLSHHV